MADDSPMVLVPTEPTKAMIDAGLRTTMPRLSLPGSQMTQNREKMRLRYKAMIQEGANVVEVKVPDAEFRVTDPKAQAARDFMGSIIFGMQADLGHDLTFSILLSCLTREMRRAYGTDAAKEVLQGFLETMDTAAQYDR